jgi:hypothetical protein
VLIERRQAAAPYGARTAAADRDLGVVLPVGMRRWPAPRICWAACAGTCRRDHDLRPVPQYDLLLTCSRRWLAALSLALAHALGLPVRAATEDRDMTAALGVNPSWLFRACFSSARRFGFAGALQPARAGESEHGPDDHRRCFVVTVVGGLGSIRGALWRRLSWA